MTTTSHVQQLIADYYSISGLFAGSIVSLVTADTDEDAATHAAAVRELSGGVNDALDNLRRYVADPHVLGRDNFYAFLERHEDNATPPDAA